MSSETLAAAAEVMGVPESLVQRSAQARAQAGGIAVDDVLGAWSGGAAGAPLLLLLPQPRSRNQFRKRPPLQRPPPRPPHRTSNPPPPRLPFSPPGLPLR